MCFRDCYQLLGFVVQCAVLFTSSQTFFKLCSFALFFQEIIPYLPPRYNNNRIFPQVKLSQIMKWYKEDFGKTKHEASISLN